MIDSKSLNLNGSEKESRYQYLFPNIIHSPGPISEYILIAKGSYCNLNLQNAKFGKRFEKISAILIRSE